MNGARILAVCGLAVGVAVSTLTDTTPSRETITVDGYQVLSGDFHVHAFVGDGGIAPWMMQDHAAHLGLDVIRDEGMRLFDDGYIKAAAKYNDLGFNSFFRTGWKRFYLKWYDKALPSAEALCPKTVELVKAVPHVHAAIFAILPPGGRLVRHRDPFAGSMRYHLGLSTPNSPDCFIVVDGENYFWRDGEGVVFDETYIHFAENKTDQTRLILFCDVERPLNSGIMTAINRFTINHLVKGTASQNMDNERVGVLNHVFGGAYRIRLLGKRIKAFNKTLYYLIKYVLIGALLYAIFA